MGLQLLSYVLGSSGNLLEEEYVDGIQLGQVCLTLLGEEIEDISLGLHLFHELVHVDLRQLLLRVMRIHDY